MAQQKAAETPDEGPEDLVDELQPGTKLLKGQYTITQYLNSGGFGITYLAKDSLDRNVVIKECFPQSFCRRSKTMVAARSRAHTAELRSVVQLFVREARNLAKIVHPNIVAVHQVFEDNGTAYMAIDYIDGLDLQQIIDGQGRMPTPEEIVVMTDKLLVAIGFIHQNDMLHRDISPDNILVSRAGEPILIDFGAAREEASQKSRAMSALRVVKDGYSPQEFYIAGSEQGPWSDLYALGATLYHLISGEAPVNGQARLAALAEERTDPYVPLEGRFDGYPLGFLRAIDIALNTLPKNRVQSAAEWRAMFLPQSSQQSAPLSAPQDSGLDAAVQQIVRRERANAVEDGAAPPAGYSAPPQFARKVSQPQPRPEPLVEDLEETAPARTGGGMVQIVAGVALAAALVGAAVLFMGGEDAPAPVAEAPAEPVTITAAAEVPPAPEAPATATTSETAAADAPAATDVASAETPPAETRPPEAPQGPVTATISAAPEVATPVPETSAAETAPAPEAAPTETTTATAEVAAEPAFPAPTGEIRSTQVAFAAWDVELPFMEDNRIIANERVAIVARVLPSADLTEAGSWLEPGLLIYAINGQDVQQSGSIASAILSTMAVDPDGRARVVVDYAGSSLERQSGLLTVRTTRLVSLFNGVNLKVHALDGKWRTEVTGVTQPSVTELRQGDILFRDKSSGTALDGAGTLEEVMANLVAQRIPVTEFSIIRNNRLESAAMQLAVD
jgi:serine/threonine protein kinase